MTICKICQHTDEKVVWNGRIRNGKFGTWLEKAKIFQCMHCGVERLEEAACLPQDSYETSEYRELVNSLEYNEAHDWIQPYHVNITRPFLSRTSTVADIGCGGGAFLDNIARIVGNTVAIEPTLAFHPVLHQRGYINLYQYCAHAHSKWANRIDVATSFDVIEHVRCPKTFLSEINQLLKPDGIVILSTPNADDFLLREAGQAYKEFFYRVVHRWYFRDNNLTTLCRNSGFKVLKVGYMQKYAFENSLRWIQEGRPTGRFEKRLSDERLDQEWKSWLERSGQAEHMYIIAKKDTCQS